MTEPGSVSVVLIVRNGARFLEQALASIRAQSNPGDEVLVVDGGSTDATVAIARAWKEVTLVPQRGIGIAAAYNTGIAAARGAFLAFLSHDDLWLPEKLAVQLQCLRERPEVQYTVARMRYFLEPGCGLPRGFRRELLDRPLPARIMETLVARRELFETVGGFDPRLSIANDVDWFARVQDAGVRGVALPDVLLLKRVHGTNASSDAARNTPELLTVLRRSVARRRSSERRSE